MASFGALWLCNHRKKWYLCKNSKLWKKCSPKMPGWKKMWNQRWQPRNGCDNNSMAKILITTIEVNLVPSPSETWRRTHKFTWIFVIRFFPLNYYRCHFLAATFIFTSFLTQVFWGRTLFHSLLFLYIDAIISLVFHQIENLQTFCPIFPEFCSFF